MTGKIFNFPSGRVGSSSKGVRPPREAHGVSGIFFSFQNVVLRKNFMAF